MGIEILTGEENHQNLHFARSVVIKALILFVIANLCFALFMSMDMMGHISAYNHLFPGRKRLPYAENPEKAYNISLFNLQAMFASHEISASPKPPDEYRVILIGDSATWGFLLPASQTLAAYLNDAGLELNSGKKMRVYNLGYPVMSLTKDLLILSYALQYEPDLIIWPLTLESFPKDKQLYAPLLQHNPEPVRRLIQDYNLDLDQKDPQFVDQDFSDRLIIGSRRALADLIRLQLYGVLWAATGIDQELPESFTSRMEDLPANELFQDFKPPHLKETQLALDALSAASSMAGKTPVLVINEPMFISQGQNSHIRYNFYYPRWAYDDYRQILYQESTRNLWYYRDFWEEIPATEFTNTAVHLTPEGTNLLAQLIANAILEIQQEN